MRQSSRIFVNTIAQYLRIIIVVVITLYSTRIVLKELGQDDFGLYSLVGSLLAFLTFLNTTLTRSTQRFLSFYMGKKDLYFQRKVLFTSLTLHLFISLFTALVALLLEPLLFDAFLNITKDKIQVAKALYRLMILNVFFVMNVTPFNAVFISHENIIFTSFVYVVLAFLKLLAAIILQYFSEDLLLIYGAAITFISLFEFILYFGTARYKYEECRHFFSFRFFDNQLLKKILSFSWWNAYGTLCILGRNQGYAFVINKFINLSVNASYGIATQVSGQVTNLIYSVSNAISPVIMRLEGAKDRNGVIYFSRIASKVSFILFVLLAIPAIAEMKTLLKWWLGDIPNYTISFVIYIMIASLCDSIAVGFRTGIQAIGEIKKFSLYVYSIKLLVIPLAVWMLIKDISPNYIFIPYVAFELLGSLMTIAIFCRMASISLKEEIILMSRQLLPCLLVAMVVSFIVVQFMNESWWRVFVTFFASIVITSIAVYAISLNRDERQFVNKLVHRLI